MSRTAVEQVVGRLVMDSAFRVAVKSDPTAALAGYDLTAEERESLLRDGLSEIDEAARNLEARVTKGVGNKYWFY